MSTQNKIPYNCREATLLIEKQIISSISIKQQHKLKSHLDACFVCEIFRQQSLLINEMFKNHFFIDDADIPNLDNDFKQTLENRIEYELNQK
jgi:hypothetical protein